MTNRVVQTVIKRDRLIVLSGLPAIIFVAVIYTVNMAVQFNKPMDVALMPNDFVSVREISKTSVGKFDKKVIRAQYQDYSLPNR